jgi:hypothetical protein
MVASYEDYKRSVGTHKICCPGCIADGYGCGPLNSCCASSARESDLPCQECQHLSSYTWPVCGACMQAREEN